jgi:A/G-specific adenine glycosylase
MLQQTQVARVVPVYAAFLARFPTLAALAGASLGDVLRQWSGLGYNRRARDLHRAARASGGALPRTAAELDALPGIGRYTARAIAAQCDDVDVPAVEANTRRVAHGAAIPFADTNIRRVVGRAVLGRTATEREALALDAALVPPRRAAAWHHALMDIGATLCRPRSPRCAECPLRPDCGYRGGEDAPRRRQSPFGSSDRRVRGAILRALADGPITMRGLRRTLGDARVPRLAAALADEGLVEIEGRRLHLPR